MKKIIFFLIAISVSTTLFSHPWKPNHYVIIDTDGGIDDMKAITMLLASPDVRVLAITVSPGSLNTGEVYIKVRSLLNSFYHEGIAVGINRICKFRSPEFPVALNSIWGNENVSDFKNAPDCINLIDEILSFEKTKISFICLGGLSTAALAEKEIPVFKQQVNEIIWSATGASYMDGFNYKIDASSADKVLKGDIPVKVISGFGEEAFYNEGMLKAVSEIPTIYAGRINGFFTSDIAKSHVYSFTANDEFVVMYLHYPSLFIKGKDQGNFISPPDSIKRMRESSLKILAGETVAKNQVIKEFPADPSFYSADIEPFVKNIIDKHGTDEWISGVIANELHRHLGVFAIVGVKMGIRAREYFDTGVDEFSAVSFAGSVPPLSCMNDGLQVSTGATPGHGLLTVINDSPALPSAEFTYMNRKIKLTLKPDIAEKISAELKEINFINGLDSNIYWELVRKNSIRYWLNLDRHDIFIIEELSR
jgi:pyrimidine-specific ribonucleoside hydrolase